jgi:prolyl oligopeptidase
MERERDDWCIASAALRCTLNRKIMMTRKPKSILQTILLTLALFAATLTLVRADAPKPITYPTTAKGDVSDTFHGVTVPDPYRWLEDADSTDSQAWIEAQNKITFGFLEEIKARPQIKERLTKLWDYERFGQPFRRGGRYFFSRNDGLQNQSVWYWSDKLDTEPKVLIDPNTLSADGTVALSGMDVSEDGKLLAYGLSASGSDWQDWRIREIDSGKDRDDLIKWVKFSNASFTHDGKGFFYSRYDEPKQGEQLKGANYFHKLFYHKLGTPQSQDVLVYERPDQKEWGFGGSVTDDGKYLVISVWKGTERKNLVFYKDLQDPNAKVVELISEFDAQYNMVDNDGSTFWFQTDKDAPRNRVVAIDIKNPKPENWKEIIPQTADTLQGVSTVGVKFTLTYLKDAHSVIKIHDLTGKHVRDVELPGIGSAGGFGGRRNETETFYTYSSYTDPGTIFRYDMETGASSVFKQPKVDFNGAEYETRQVFYKSKDGTKVPMFITHRKGLMRNSNNPTLLYGYGGFNQSLTPGFSPATIAWLEMGGVYAVANLRGGGEYGKEWHDAGKKLKKQNVFDDFIAGAEWLIANKYTQSSKLAIQGGSNGGLLVGACMAQRPDLFGAALPAVGVLDMLRFHKFTIGWAWTSDYGSVDNKEEFEAMYKYSPLHNLKPGTNYPATMITTADHDDRVFPGHSFKFAAALQAAHKGSNPVMIRIEQKAGHGAGKPTSKRIEEIADQFSFLTRVLNMNVPLKKQASNAPSP